MKYLLLSKAFQKKFPNSKVIIETPTHARDMDSSLQTIINMCPIPTFCFREKHKHFLRCSYSFSDLSLSPFFKTATLPFCWFFCIKFLLIIKKNGEVEMLWQLPWELQTLFCNDFIAIRLCRHEYYHQSFT